MRTLISIHSLLMILLIIAASCQPKKENTEADSQMPNILLIVADDMGFSDIIMSA